MAQWWERSPPRDYCGLGSIPVQWHMWVEFVVGHRLLRGFLSGFPPSTSTSISKSNPSRIEDTHES